MSGVRVAVRHTLFFGSAAAVLALATASASVVAGGGAGPRRNANSLVFAPDARPYGKTYGEWAAEFWQYALEFPVEGHPFLDTPEYDFAAGQSGKVWFW